MARSESTAAWPVFAMGEALAMSELNMPAELLASGSALPSCDVALGSAWAPVQGGLPRWRLKRVLAYVDDNLSHDISLDDLARVACLSSHHFSELFRQSIGTSPYRYVMARRVECAKVMLRTSVKGVLEIALAVGFSDQSHFSKVFRRATGTTPGLYRAGA